MNIRDLFKGYPKTSQGFLDYCIKNDELCELDIDYLKFELFGEISAQNNFTKYLYLNEGSLFDYLESRGLLITYKIKTLPTPKFIPVVYQKGKGFPIYTRKGCKSREEALYNAFRNGILKIENNNE